MKRCSIPKCEKKANNDGLCKFHRCRCNTPSINSVFSFGCLIHGKNSNNPQQKDNIKFLGGFKK